MTTTNATTRFGAAATLRPDHRCRLSPWPSGIRQDNPDADVSSYWNKCTRLAHRFLENEQRDGRQHVFLLAERGFRRQKLSGHGTFALRSCRWRSPALQYADALLVRPRCRDGVGATEYAADLRQRGHLLYIVCLLFASRRFEISGARSQRFGDRNHLR